MWNERSCRRKETQTIAPLDVPASPEAITPAWLTDALCAGGVIADAVVTSIGREVFGTQGWTTQMARLALTYDGHYSRAPTTLVAKCSAEDVGTRRFFGRFYERELFFYRSIAPDVPLRVPRCYYADYDPSTLSHVILLEDMAPAVVGDHIGGIGVDVAAAYTRCIATLHARWWESPQLADLAARYPAPGLTFARGYATRLARGLEAMRPHLDRTTCRLAERLQGGLQERWARQSTEPRTLIHWDAHAANLMLPSPSGGAFAVVDWQNWTVARGIWDVARFCALSLPVEARRASDRDMVALYAETLATLGIRDYPVERAWADYLDAMPLQFAQQVRFFGSLQPWTDGRRAWVTAIAPRIVAALHDAAEAGVFD
jgi:Phosphotransferase enzyme family